MKKQIIIIGIISCAVMNTALFGTVAAEESADIASLRESIAEGANLYKYNGCATCHGEDGNSPVKVTFPKLRGKDATYLLERMESFVSSEGSSSEKSVMHREYYSDEALAQCDEPPTQAQLKLMASWLATR